MALIEAGFLDKDARRVPHPELGSDRALLADSTLSTSIIAITISSACRRRALP